MNIIKKFYSKEDNMFYVEYHDGFDNKIRKYKTFKGFLNFVNSDLSNSNLYDCDFKDIDLSKFDISDAGISSIVLKEQNLYDNSFYIKNIENYNIVLEHINPNANDIVIIREMPLKCYEDLYEENEICISYISDLHLNHKIHKRFTEFASKQEIIDYLKNVASKMKSDYANSHSQILLIGGDVSFNFNIAELFYRELSKAVHGKIIVVLGNHEFWDISLNRIAKMKKTNPIDYIIEKYRILFDKLNITLIQNELLTLKYVKRPYPYYEINRLSEGDLASMDSDQILAFCNRSILTIFGGVGFSGYAPKYNASIGIYREAIKTLDEDLLYTKNFEKLYSKCTEALISKEIIVLTHMPMENWCALEHVSNWTYVNGHTHQNYFISDDKQTVFADNQIGYYKNEFGLKHFYMSKEYDVFQTYEDGIYEIDKIDYLDFYRGHNVSVTYNRENVKIRMLKKSGIYCFIQESLINGRFSILNGGSPKKLNEKKDLQYYYDNLDFYAETTNYFMSKYNSQLKEISSYVRSFGGSGRIHGSIVDVDFYDHLYLNPLDGKIIPYFAYSMTDKYVYSNLSSLLFNKNKLLFDRYIKLIGSESTNSGLINFSNDLVISKKKKFAPETDIYRFSRIANNLQYLTKMKVVRTWNEELVNSKESIDTKRLLFIDLTT